MRRGYKVSVGISEGMRSVARTRSRWEDTISCIVKK
jgi:hypothetical protein